MRESVKKEEGEARPKAWTLWMANARHEPEMAGSAVSGAGSAATSLHLFMDSVSITSNIFSSV